MKKIYRIFTVAALAVAAASCVQEQFETVIEEIETGEGLIVTAGLPTEGNTKVSYNMDAEKSVLKTSWSEGDVIYYTTGSGNGTAFTQVGAISEDGKFTQFQNTSASISANKEMLFTYPVAYKTSASGQFKIYSHDGTLENVMASMDYLYGYAKTDANKVIPNIEFDRVSAFLEIKDLTFPADVNAAIKTIYIVSPSMGDRAYLDISKKTLSVYRDATMVINPKDYNIVNGKVQGNQTLYAAFFPTAEAAAGDDCTLMFQTEDGTMYQKAWKAGSVYEAGKMYSVTGEVEKPITFNIQFEDPEVKNILVGGNNFYGCDKNGDGELSNVEAAVLTTLNWMFFQNTKIEKFNEFVHFTGITTFVGSNSSGGGGFYGCTNLKEITLPASVTVIGSDAFNGCTSLETFVVPETVEKINAGAFRNCTALKNVTIPATVSYMGEGQTFRDCKSLKTLVWPAATTTINSSMFQDSGLETFTIPENITEIGSDAFNGCVGLRTVTIPASVKTIGASAFKGCTGISTFTVPAGVEKINNEAFFGTGATSISIPATVTTIGQKAFNNNPGITSFTIAEGSDYSVSEDVSMVIKTSGTTVEAVSFFGNKTEISFPENVNKLGNYFAQGSPELVKVNIPAVTTMGTGVFSNCPKLTTAIYNEAATTTGNNTFQNCTALVNVTLPEGATQIGSNLFNGCSAIKTLSIPAAVTKINSNAFQNCASLESITLPENLTEIVANLFKGCTSLKSIAIPEKVTKIGNSAFSGCTSLTDISLPAAVTAIPNAMLEGCTGIKTITLGETINTINANAFKGSGLTSFTFPSKVTKINSSTFANCKDLKSITIPSTITSIESNAFDGSGLETISVPESIKEIKSYSFQNCESLTTVTLPETVTKVGTYAFQNCTALTTINWTDKLATIDNYAFKGCTSLKSVTIPAGVLKFGISAFDSCTSLTEVILHEGMTGLGTWVFQNCTALKSITIPSSVTSLGSSTFSGCTAMEDIVLLSTTPCSVSYSVFPYENEDFVIYVPDAALEDYKAHKSWSVEQLAGRIFAISTRQ